MNPEEIALPWFPITPEYIDKYHDSVLKYLRDAQTEHGQDLSNDSSYNTTRGLLSQRSEQIFAEICNLSLRSAEELPKSELEKDIKILAASAYLEKDAKSPVKKKYLALLTYLLALRKSDISDILVPLFIRVIKAESIDNVGFDFESIISFDVLKFVKALNNVSVTSYADDSWYENHGTVRINKDSISIFDLNRFFINMKMKSGSSFKPLITAEEGGIEILQDKREKKLFSINTFLNTLTDIHPEAPEEEKKKVYADGDVLTVRVLNKSYDTIFAESTDPAYETIAGQIVIESASNVRGLYMTDFTRNLSLGAFINVTYRQNGSFFSIDDTVIDFIRKTFWEDDEENQHYMKMNAMLLFPFNGPVKNTWITEYGFLVRTEFEALPRYTYRSLNIVTYDDGLDFFLATVGEEVPERDHFEERVAKDNFIRLLLYKNNTISTPAKPKKVNRTIEKDLISLLHRILAIKQDKALKGSLKKDNYISICCALAAISEDLEDLDYYSFSRAYLQALVAFAQKKFKDIKVPEELETKDLGVLQMRTMAGVLKEYDKSEESNVLISVIDQLEDTKISDVAKLVQASNRFIGSNSLERLRGDLHREICTILNVTDAIVAEQDDSDNGSFPFLPEDDHIEHKMSWVYDNATGAPNETSQSSKILKTLCAFMNRYVEQGESHLYIGTDEKRRYINGVQADIDFLISKGELCGQGDLNDEFCRHIMTLVKKRFPDSYQYVSPHFLEDGKVLDLCVSPASQGIIYFDGVPYYRYGSESRVMPDNIKQEILDKKYLLHSDMTDKIDAIKRAIQTGKTVVLKGYDSSNSITSGADRTVEAFSFVDNGRFDAIWAYDFNSKEKKNKVFLLKRAATVEITNRNWAFAKQHKTFQLDMFGFYGSEKIAFTIELKTPRAKNILLEQYQDAKKYLEVLPEGRWRVATTLFNLLSLSAACGFYLAFADEVEIIDSPAFKDFVTERLSHLVEQL